MAHVFDPKPCAVAHVFVRSGANRRTENKGIKSMNGESSLYSIL